MVSPEKAADVERRLRQNKNDVEHFSDLLGKVEVQTAETNTKVDNLTTEVASLRTDVTGLQTGMSQLDTRVGALEVKVDAGFDQVNGRFDQVNGRFDRLEQLLAPPDNVPEGEDIMRESTERRLGYLETKVDLHRSLTTGYGDDLKQHKHMFEIQAERLDAHERRFDHLDSQMTEVLGILRGANK